MMTEVQLESPRRTRVLLLVVVLVLLGGSIGWQLYSARKSRVAVKTRKTSDFLVTWVCLECGHELEDNAGPGPQTCPACGEEALYASFKYACPEHGLFRVAFNYDSEGNPTTVRVADGDWVARIDPVAKRTGLRCPICGRSLIISEAPRMPASSAETDERAAP